MHNQTLIDFIKKNSFSLFIESYQLYDLFSSPEEKQYYHDKFFYIKETINFLSNSGTNNYYKRHLDTLCYAYDMLSQEINELDFIDNNEFQHHMLNQFIKAKNPVLINKTLKNIQNEYMFDIKNMDNPLLCLLNENMTLPVLKEVLSPDLIEVINSLPDAPDDQIKNNFIENYINSLKIVHPSLNRRTEDLLNLQNNTPFYRQQFLFKLYFNAMGFINFHIEKDKHIIEEKIDIISFFHQSGLTLSKKESDELLESAILTERFEKNYAPFTHNIFKNFDFYGEGGKPVYEGLRHAFIDFSNPEEPKYNLLSDILFNKNIHILHNMQKNENVDILNLWIMLRTNFIKAMFTQNYNTTNPAYIELIFIQTDNLMKTHDLLMEEKEFSVMDMELSKQKIKDILNLKIHLHESCSPEMQRDYFKRIFEYNNKIDTWHKDTSPQLKSKTINRI